MGRTRFGRRRCLWAAPVAAFACIAMVAARADAAWSPFFNVAAHNYVSEPRVAMDSAGDTVFMWRETEGSGWWQQGHGTLYTRSRHADGSLTPIQEIARRVPARQVPDVGDDVAVDSLGNAYFVWRTYVNGAARVRARVLSADGTLGPTRTLRTIDRRALPDDPMVAAGSGGAVFAWSSFINNQGDLMEARAMSASGRLGPVRTVGPGAASESDMGVDSQGRATFVWRDWARQEDDGLAEFTRVMAPDGKLGPVRRVSEIAGVGWPQVAVTPAGRAVFEWDRYKPDTFTLVTRVRASDGTLQPAQVVRKLDGSQVPVFEFFQLAVAPTGEAVYCWNADGAIHARTRAAGGTFGPARRIGSTPLAPCRPGIDSEGNLALAWYAPVGSQSHAQSRVFVRSEDPAGQLGPTRALSAAGHNANAPVLAMGSAGPAAVAWSEGANGFGIQASVGP
jgi:hypothetical protein